MGVIRYTFYVVREQPIRMCHSAFRTYSDSPIYIFTHSLFFELSGHKGPQRDREPRRNSQSRFLVLSYRCNESHYTSYFVLRTSHFLRSVQKANLPDKPFFSSVCDNVYSIIYQYSISRFCQSVEYCFSMHHIVVCFFIIHHTEMK
jgi:hypothetical protein